MISTTSVIITYDSLSIDGKTVKFVQNSLDPFEISTLPTGDCCGIGPGPAWLYFTSQVATDLVIYETLMVLSIPSMDA